jgi:hypothetical protein
MTTSLPLRASLARPPTTASGGQQLHRLCSVCARTQFDLSTLHACEGLLCVDSVGDRTDSAHTAVLDHQPTRAALEASAGRAGGAGCHLCALLLAALRHRPLNDYSGGSHTDLTHEEAIAKCIARINGEEEAKPPPGVTVAFVRNEKEGEEAIVVHCEGKYATLLVTKPPTGKCVDQSTEEKEPLFVTQVKYGSHDGDDAAEWPDELIAKTGFPGGIYKAGMVRSLSNLVLTVSDLRCRF